MLVVYLTLVQINANKLWPPTNAGYFRVHSRLHVGALPALCKMYDVTLNWPRYFTRHNNDNIFKDFKNTITIVTPLWFLVAQRHCERTKFHVIIIGGDSN